jgi:hypothetical protein
MPHWKTVKTCFVKITFIEKSCVGSFWHLFSLKLHPKTPAIKPPKIPDNKTPMDLVNTLPDGR